MKNFFLNNIYFLLLLAVWTIIGMASTVAIFVVLPLSLFLLFRKERYWELFLGFLFILILSDSRHYELEFAKSVKNIYIILLTLFLVLGQKGKEKFNSYYKRFLPFFLIAILCLLNSPIPLTSFQKLFSYLLLLLVVPNYVIRIQEQLGWEGLKRIVYFILSLLLIGLALKYTLPELVHTEGRFSGVFGNPNGLGLFCFLFYILFALLEDKNDQLFSKVEKVVIMCIVGLSLILAGSRGAILAVIIFVLFRYVFKIAPVLGLAVLIVMIIGYEFVVQNFTYIIFSLGLQEYFRIETLETGSGRSVAWQFAWINIKDSLFFGGGFGFTEYLFRENYRALSVLGHQGNAHNSYLTLWLNTGFFGLLLYMWALISLFLKGAKQSRLAFPILFSILFSVNIESWLMASLNPFTILLFVALTLLIRETYVKSPTSDPLLV